MWILIIIFNYCPQAKSLYSYIENILIKAVWNELQTITAGGVMFYLQSIN